MERVKAKRQSEFIKWMNPILVALHQLGGSGTPAEVTEQVAQNEKVSDEVLVKISKTGVPTFYNQVAWARQYLVWEKLLDSSKRGKWALTERGYNTVLSLDESRSIVLKWIGIHAEARRSKDQGKAEEETIEEQTESEPEKSVVRLIDVLRSLTSEGFEQVCQRLLDKTGFKKVEVTRRGPDGGIDGFGYLQVNPFVKMRVAFQCKKYAADHPVSVEHISRFRDVTRDKFEKAIMITTSRFTAEAIKAANEGPFPIELVNGDRLVELFEEVELGVTPVRVYDVDLTFFQPFTSKTR